ncbi:MAG: methionine--tRNA ligase [Flavobacteriales bacterium]|nr:methionine--tRNA ligase [Flavobacteriales bacterium]
MALPTPKKHLITAALPYANGPIHIGHLAGAYLPADIYARYLRMKGDKVAFICGSDEHGAAITLRAKKEGKTPQAIVDEYHEINKKAFADFGIEFDLYHRTSSEIHHQTAQEFFLELNEKDVFTKETREQFYDADYNQFLADRYITGICPKCGHDGAYGDQCENCGSSLNSTELINPVSTLSGNTPVLKETSHWYLPMERHETWLKEWIEKGTLEGKAHHNPKEWRNQVIGQCKSWIDGGLQSRAMTRDLDWGVKVPLEGADGKVLYVWLDAPIGYISATKEWASNNGEDWKSYWQDENTELIHFIGKDNIVFHCIIFPILLKANGKYNLPVNVPANEFLNLEGKKISTSRNWAVWLHEYLIDFPEKQDVLRYVLCSIAPETKDSEFTWEDFQARNNNELVAIYGNFVNRAIVLVHKYYEGIVPEINVSLVEEYPEIVNQLNKQVLLVQEKLSRKQFRDAQNEAIAIARLGNKFLADTEPWKLIKTNSDQVKLILNLSLQIAANAAIALAPFLPDSSKKLNQMLSLNGLSWERLGQVDLVKGNVQLGKAEHLFQKLEDDSINAQIQKLENSLKSTEAESNIEPFKDNINFDDFLKLDLRVGTIVSAEAVKKSSKLLLFKVDMGSEVRTIVSGIAKHYSPEEMVGKQVQVVANLAPRKIMGIESQGMILMAEGDSGDLSLMQPDKMGTNGSQIS